MNLPVTPRGLPDPGAPTVPQTTLSRWSQFLGSIAAGIHLPDAMLKHYISRADIEACIRSDSAERQRFDDARLAALKVKWSVFDLEDVFERIAQGMPVGKAIAAVRGIADASAPTGEFNRLVVLDTILNEQYMRALKSRALILGEEIIEQADDSSNDMASGKNGDIPNNAAVNRSKLKVETRLRLMGSWFPRLFGEAKNQVQVNVQVNHAKQLEEARARRDNKGLSAPVRSISQDVVDATFRDASAGEDTSWLDNPDSTTSTPPGTALDTTWLEER